MLRFIILAGRSGPLPLAACTSCKGLKLILSEPNIKKRKENYSKI